MAAMTSLMFSMWLNDLFCSTLQQADAMVKALDRTRKSARLLADGSNLMQCPRCMRGLHRTKAIALEVCAAGFQAL
jgi:hypothetical protein